MKRIEEMKNVSMQMTVRNNEMNLFLNANFDVMKRKNFPIFLCCLMAILHFTKEKRTKFLLANGADLSVKINSSQIDQIKSKKKKIIQTENATRTRAAKSKTIEKKKMVKIVKIIK